MTMIASGAEHAVQQEHVPMEGWENLSKVVFDWVMYIGVVSIILSIVLCLWRLLRGPTLVDRGIASDTIAIQVVALVILLTVVSRSLVLFDAVLIVSILGFAGTVAFAQFIGRKGSAI
jgi:multicomponent K+:H+ antiporter subunit F